MHLLTALLITALCTLYPPACCAGSGDAKRTSQVKPEAASFAYYDGPEYNQ